MKRRFWFPETALCLACLMAVIGAVPRGAAAEIAFAGRPATYAGAAQGSPGWLRAAAADDVHPGTGKRVRVPTWIIVVVATVVAILWLVYRTFAGWKPMIS
ncbi:MAG: hypothetical protein ACM3L8_05815 [Verrucomicrobiota bacterium]